MPVRLGFIGLGTMGTPMARRLLQAGHPVTVWAAGRGDDAARLGWRGAR